MIAGLRGTLARWDDASSTLWLDVGGVIYEVLIPAFASSWVATHEEGVEMALFTYYHVNERQPRPVLIGFPRLAERDFFRKFIEVPDVGPVRAVRALDRQVSEESHAPSRAATRRPCSSSPGSARGRLRPSSPTSRDASSRRLRCQTRPATCRRQESRRARRRHRGAARTPVRPPRGGVDGRRRPRRAPRIDDLETLLRAVLEQRVRG